MIIYKATFLNGKSYIGLIHKSGKTLNHRIKDHIKRRYGKHEKHKKYFHKAINKYGCQNIIWSILQDNIDSIQFLKERQIFNILKYDTYMSDEYGFGGYNMTIGGDGCIGYNSKWLNYKNPMLGKHHSKQTKQKMIFTRNNKSRPTKQWKEKWCKSIKQAHAKRDCSLSQQTKRKIKQKRICKKMSDITKEKFSKMFSGVGNPFFGRHHSKQTIQKIKQARKRRQLNKVK